MNRQLFFSILTLIVACLALSACIRYAQVKPEEKDFIGTYLPENLTEKGIHAKSELIIYPQGRCTLINFPVVDYATRVAQFEYYDLDGTWKLDNSTGNWQVTITFPGKEKITLRILNNQNPWMGVTPYKVCQEGEDLEDDSLIFDQHPLLNK